MKHLALGMTVAIMATLLCGTASSADVNLKTRVARAEAEITLAKQAIALEEKCGAAIEVEINWTNFPEDAFDNYSVAGYCETLIDSVASHCEAGAAKKKWIAQNIDTLVCAYAPDDAPNTRIDTNGKRVTGHFNFGTSNLEDHFRAALLHSL